MANNGRSVPTPRRAKGKSKLTIYCDGRCKLYSEGLKGSWSFVVEKGEGQVIHEQSGFCENDANVTNIVAEYQAVIEGLRWAYFDAGDSFDICTNLALIEQQVSGKCRVKAAKLVPLRDEVRTLLDTMKANLRWIPKGQHKRAALLTRDVYH